MGQFKTAETIKTVIGWMRDNQLLIPAFQRDYVWKHTQVENLFDSLMRGYPISSMLFWRVTGKAKTSYQFYEFLRSYVEYHDKYNNSLPGCETKESFLAVLDGQQRLTSLYIGLCGTFAYHAKYQSWDKCEKSFPPRKLYLNLSVIRGDEEDGNYDEEKKYQFSFLTSQETNNFQDIVVKENNKWFLVGKILQLDTISSFVRQHALNEIEEKMLETLKEQICTKLNINYYEEDTVAPDQAVNIFIRINAGGTYLSMSDILMSILRAGWKLDARVATQTLIDKIAGYDFYIGNDYIIKVLLYLESDNIKNLIQNFNNEFLNRTEQKWSKIEACVECLFDLLRRFGLNHSTLLSYNATLPILYYLYNYSEYEHFGTHKKYEKERINIRKWLFKTLLLKSFGTTSDSVLNNARKPMKEAISLTEFPSSNISRAIGQLSEIAPEEIEEFMNVQKDDRRAFLILTLLFPDYSVVEVDKDHMHPMASYKDYVKLAGNDALEEWQYNSVSNLQLLTSSDNKSKGDTSFEEWVNSYSANCKYDLYAAAYIPRGIDLSLANFNTFYIERRKLLSEAIKTILVP